LRFDEIGIRRNEKVSIDLKISCARYYFIGFSFTVTFILSFEYPE